MKSAQRKDLFQIRHWKRISVILKINVSANDLGLIKEKEKKWEKLIWSLDLCGYTWIEEERMVHKTRSQDRIRAGSKLHKGSYIGMHASDCICLFPDGRYIARDG